MEIFWGLIPIGIGVFCIYLDKITRLEKDVKKLEKKTKGDNSMSKILSELKGMKCKLESDAATVFAGKREFECTIIDVDDEWIKLEYITKKGENKTRIMRVEEVISVEM